MKNDLPIPLLTLLYSVLALFVLNASLTSVSSPFIVSELGADRTINFYPVAFFTFGTVVTVPLTKPLFARFGIYSVLMGSLFLFFLMNFLTGLMPTYFFVNLFRYLAGLATGPTYALLNQGIYLLVPPEKRNLTSWIYSTVLLSMPIIGGAWGGIIAYLYHWQCPFFVDAFIALFLMFLISSHKGKLSLPYSQSGAFDWIGWFFYAISITLFTFSLTTSQQLDWYRSPLLVTAIFIALPSFGYFLLRSFIHPAPIYDFRLLKKPLFLLSAITLTILFMTYYGVIILLNVWLTFDVQFTPNWIAALLCIMAIAAFFPHLIITDWIFRFDPRNLLLLSTAILAFTSFFTCTFWFEINFGRIIFARLFAGIGFALALPTIIQILTKVLPIESRIDAQEFYQGIRHLASGLGACIFNIMWQRQSVFYHERLNEGLNLQNFAVQSFLSQKKVLEVPVYSLAELNLFLDNQSWTLALEDVFFLMGWVMVALFFTHRIDLLF